MNWGNKVTRSDELYISRPYRPGVGAMILNKENKVFVGKRIDNKTDSWQMPQGGIDDNETPDDAVIREVAEETGIIASNLTKIAQSRIWFYYDVPDVIIPKIWEGQYRGQKQKWFLFKYYGDGGDINISNGYTPEFSEFRWIDIKDLPLVIVPFKKKLYVEIMEEFDYFIQQLQNTANT